MFYNPAVGAVERVEAAHGGDEVTWMEWALVPFKLDGRRDWSGFYTIHESSEAY